MNAQEFFNVVVTPNVDAAWTHPDDLRHAVNAILTLESFFGILAIEKGRSDDAVFKKELTLSHGPYKLLQDTAHALKHGVLSRATVQRLTASASSVNSQSPKWHDEGRMLDEMPFSEPDKVVFAHYEQNGTQGRIRVALLVKSVQTLASSCLEGQEAPVVTLDDIKFIFN